MLKQLPLPKKGLHSRGDGRATIRRPIGQAMFRSSRPPPPPPEPPPPPPPPPETPARRFLDAPEAIATVIGPGTHIKGDLSGGDGVDIAGTLEGHSNVTGAYRVREGGRVVGDLSAADLVLEGQVSGHNLSADKIEIGAAARVRGHIHARVVAIAEGAVFDGTVHMSGAGGPGGAVAFTEKRKGGRRGGEGSPAE
jgi:cytoskeletal protein CcmA (bactofilin family)